jgi:hypothetical protein
MMTRTRFFLPPFSRMVENSFRNLRKQNDRITPYRQVGATIGRPRTAAAVPGRQ